MVGGGFSIQGSYHEKNQDSYWVGEVSGGYVAALSDGLGSCGYSEIGSRTLCEVVRELADSQKCLIKNADMFARQVEDNWRLDIRHKLYKIEDCHATALFAVAVLVATSAWLGGKADAKRCNCDKEFFHISIL